MKIKNKNINVEDVDGVIFDSKTAPEYVFKDTIDTVNRLLERHKIPFKVYTSTDPYTKGSSDCGFILSPIKLSKKTVERLSNEAWGL